MSPWIALGLDVLVLLLLLLAAPKFTELICDCRVAAPRLCWAAASATLSVILLISVGIIFFGSSDAALAALRRDPITITPTINFGSGRPNEIVEATVEIANRSGAPVQIYGGSSDCSCHAINDLPVTIEPGQSIRLHVALRRPNVTGWISRSGYFRTDYPAVPKLYFRMTGQVVMTD